MLQLITECITGHIPEAATVMALAAFGGHIDHLTARFAATRLKQRIILYEDLPYGTRTNGREEAEKFLGNGWRTVTVELDKDLIDQYLKLFAIYASQASQEVPDEISGYLKRDGMRLWMQS